ncbi:MAG: M50 family metallopeptidase [Nitriliruptoraceae bacterium]
MSGPWSITAFVLSLIVAIMLHEAGHFLTARKFGMRADRFFLGFGPTLWSFRRGETEYGVKALPLGGFVRIVGMSDDDVRHEPIVDEVDWHAAEARHRFNNLLTERGTPPAVRERIFRRVDAIGDTDSDRMRAAVHQILITEVDDTHRIGDLHHRLLRGDDERFFRDRPAWQRAMVLVSGSAAHFVIAIALLVGAYATLPLWTGDYSSEVAAVQEGSPAAAAGLRPGDRLTAVAGVASEDFTTLRDVIRDRAGQPTALTLLRGQQQLTIELTPVGVEDPATGATIGVAGFAPEMQMDRLGPVEAVTHALIGQPELGNPGGFIPMFTGSLRALFTVFSPSGIGEILAQATGQQPRSIDGAVSLVGAASIAGQVGEVASGLVLFIGLIAVVNVFIGIFNLMPLPPLDGGHLAALAYERTVNLTRQLRGRQPDYHVDPRALAAIAVPVLAILSVVVLALLWLDITDPIRLG